MIVLVLLLASWLIFRGIGAMGVPSFATWHASARYALVVMFVFTATGCLTVFGENLLDAHRVLGWRQWRISSDWVLRFRLVPTFRVV